MPAARPAPTRHHKAATKRRRAAAQKAIGGNPNVSRWLTGAQLAGQQYKIPPSIILGLIEVESGGNPQATSGVGAKGLTQFMPGTAKSYDVDTSPAGTTSQINGAAKYLKALGYGKDPDKALASYNGGPGNPQYDYAKKVMAAAKHYEGADHGFHINDDGQVRNIGDQVSDTAGGVVDAATAIPKFLGHLGVIFTGDFWARVGLVVLGIVLIVVSVILFGREYMGFGPKK